jgi:hypothetical protein
MVKKFYLRIIAALLAISILGLSIINNYGFTWDEWVEQEMVDWTIKYVTKKEPIPGDLQYYGFVFNYSSDLVFSVRKFVEEVFHPETESINPERKRIINLKEKLDTKHIVTFLFSLLAYLAVAGIVGILAGWDFAWLGVFTLMLFPRFWGHSFFNPKDIPFAVVFTVISFLGAYLINFYLNQDENKLKIGNNKITFYSLGYGGLLGLLTGIRIGGFITFFLLILAHVLTHPHPKNILKNLLKFSKFYLLIFVGLLLATALFYPVIWVYPSGFIGWFFDSLNYFSQNHVFNNPVLYNGQAIPAKSMPWTYIPVNFFLSIPTAFFFLFLFGLIGLIVRYKSFSYLQRACAILVVLQIFFMPTMAIFSKPSLSDGMRHFLFIMPGVCAIATTTIIWIYQSIKNKNFKLFFVTVIILSLLPIVVDMITLHPYEYVYFNEISGGLAQANGKQETEYYGLSIKEASEWMNENAKPNSTVVVTGPQFVYDIFIKPEKNLKVVYIDQFKFGLEPNPDYYIALHRYNYPNNFADCGIIHQVERQNVPFMTIKQCR